MKKIVLILMLTNMFVYGYENIEAKVRSIYPSTNNKVYFTLHNDTCNDGNYYTFNMETTAIAKQWYAMLLTAATTGAPIYISLDNCHTGSTQAIRYMVQNYDN